MDTCSVTKRDSMIVTDITEASKSKYKIFIDGEFSFVLYKGELRSLKIKKGEAITEEIYEEIISNLLPKRAKLRAMHLLEKRPYTETELRRKLKENMYSDTIINIALDYVKSYGYVDDKNYAIQYISTYSDSKSTKQMEQKLIEKGINKRIIDEAIEIARDMGDAPDERKLIRKAIEKKRINSESLDRNELAKMIRYLASKGFSMDLIRDELRNFDDMCND